VAKPRFPSTSAVDGYWRTDLEQGGGRRGTVAAVDLEAVGGDGLAGVEALVGAELAEQQLGHSTNFSPLR